MRIGWHFGLILAVLVPMAGAGQSQTTPADTPAPTVPAPTIPAPHKLAAATDSQPAQPDSGYIAWQLFPRLRPKRFRFYLAEVQGEKAQDWFRRRRLLIHQDKCPRNPPLRVLPRGLLEKQIQRLTPTVKTVPVVRFRQQFDFTHAPRL